MEVILLGLGAYIGAVKWGHFKEHSAAKEAMASESDGINPVSKISSSRRMPWQDATLEDQIRYKYNDDWHNPESNYTHDELAFAYPSRGVDPVEVPGFSML
jgi:hypothetical protein